MRDRMRRLLQLLSTRLRRSRRDGLPPVLEVSDGPLLSVVVVGSHGAGVGELSDCLESLERQALRRLQIILVAGSAGAAPAELAAFAARDPRVVISSDPAASTGSARRAGASAATAPYLTFLNASDTVPPDAYRRLVTALEQSGSDVAAGAVRLDRNGKRSTPAWSTAAHRVQVLGTTVEESPQALQDVFLGNRVFRRDFWHAAAGHLPTDHAFDDAVPSAHWNERMGPYGEGVAYDDQLPVLVTTLRARRLDLLTAVTCISRLRQRFGASPVDEQVELGSRLEVLSQARGLVAAEGSARAVAAWTARVLSVELPVLIRHALAVDDRYRSTLRAAAAELLADAGSEALADTPVDRKLLVALAAAGRWEDADALLETVRLDGPIPPTSIVDGRIEADLPFANGFAPEILELSREQTRLAVVIERVGWDAVGALTIDGWGLVHGVDLGTSPPELAIDLVEAGGRSEHLRVDVVPRRSPAATRWADDPWHRYDCAGFRAVIPLSALQPPDPPTDPLEARQWRLRVRLSADGVVREGFARTLTTFGTSDRLPSSPVLDATDPRRVLCLFDETEGFHLQVRSDVVRAATLVAEADGALSGVIRALAPMAVPPGAVELVNGRVTDRTPLTREAEDTYAFRFPPGLAAAGTRSLRLVPERGRGPRVGWPEDRTTPALVRAGDHAPGWQRSPRGNVQVVAPRPRCQVQDVELTGEHLRLLVTIDQLTATDLQTAALATSVTTVLASSVSRLDGHWLIEFAMSAPAWPLGSVQPLPSGRYEVTVQSGGDAVAATAGTDLLDRLPIEQVSANHGLTVQRAARSTRVHLLVRPPLAEDERARAGQHRLQRRYADTTFDSTEQVLFQCYRGESVTDSQLALHDELRRRDAQLDLVWGIADRSVELPDGARGVLVGSRAWYEALGRSRYLCSNIDFDRFLRRRPHQRFLQTFHGYPFKSMGIPFWRSKGFSERAIAEECDRRNRAWTSILVPAPFCADLYRECYSYEGEILVTGYPRDDALVRPEPGVRDRVLTRLGVPAGRRVVLYAPTWRESDAITARKAKLFDELEVDRLADALGADHTILLRGHTRTRHTSGAGPAGRAEILDVTRYPEINDLILAADVAVLDYSSLRFDWLLTGKPLLFFVPDLESYLAQRTALFDFGPTAPGPLLRTTDGVIDALRDLERVSATYAAQRTEANAEFNALNDGSAAARVVDAFFSDVVSSTSD